MVDTIKARGSLMTIIREASLSLDLVHDARLVTRNARRLEAQIAAINKRRRELIAKLYEQGLRQAEIARLLDISRQRVTQYIDELRKEGRLPAAGNKAQDDDQDDDA